MIKIENSYYSNLSIVSIVIILIFNFDKYKSLICFLKKKYQIILSTLLQ
jgi:hypothetical protein